LTGEGRSGAINTRASRSAIASTRDHTPITVADLTPRTRGGLTQAIDDPCARRSSTRRQLFDREYRSETSATIDHEVIALASLDE
jgi:hypothetical protein